MRVACKEVHCKECGRLVGEGCLRRVLHQHKLYPPERCAACWVVTHPAPDVVEFSMTFATRARALARA